MPMAAVSCSSSSLSISQSLLVYSFPCWDFGLTERHGENFRDSDERRLSRVGRDGIWRIWVFALQEKMQDQSTLLRRDFARVKVICSLCDTEQDVQQNCVQCGVCMGKYYCSKCKFYDDDVSKNQYHCDKCGICRIGGEENFFHCNKCECCYSKLMQDSHTCVERALHHNCPVCFEFLFDTTRDITVLPCGHTIHLQCVKEMEQHFQYSCPVCSKSYCDMSRVWQKLDQEVASTPMPPMYRNKNVWILCNDCGETSEVNFHILGHKCFRCNSYNTKQTRGQRSSYSTRTEEAVH